MDPTLTEMEDHLRHTLDNFAYFGNKLVPWTFECSDQRLNLYR